MSKLINMYYQKYKQDFVIALAAIIGFFLFIPIFTYAYFANTLSSKERIMNRNDTGITLLDRNNRPFFTFYQAKYKTIVPISDVSKDAQHAIIASEDKEFYSHTGFSPKGILRSIFVDIRHNDLSSGGSTITQQLVKNALLSSNKTFLRKIQEIVLAQELERRYSKDEILEMYLNSVYFGEGAFGIEEAANTYFGKKARDLTIAESGMLSAILPSPSSLSPLSGDLQKAKNLQKIVLNDMAKQGYITSSQEAEAEGERLQFSSQKDHVNVLAPHFAIMVRDELIAKYGEEPVARSGFKVQTTLDSNLQAFSENAVARQVARLRTSHVSNGAAVAMDPKTGEILALVGSYDWFDEKYGKVNMATSPRQPGSSFKPIVYIAGFEERVITPATLLEDQPTIFANNYKPQNFDRKFRGQVLVRRALANSLNVPSVQVMQKVGVENALEMAKRFGITTLSDASNYGPSLVLGAGNVPLLEMTNVYATFANEGKKNDPTAILKIVNKDGYTLYTYNPRQKNVIDKTYTFLISSIISDSKARLEAFGNALGISRLAAVKTGTSEDFRDSLTFGYTPSVTVGVWVGNNDNGAMDRVAGSLGAWPIWRDIMERMLAGTDIEQFNPPAGIISKTICNFDGFLAKEATTSSQLEYFVSSTEPTRYCGGQPLSTQTQQQPTQTPKPTSSQAPTQTPTPTSIVSPTLTITQKPSKKAEGHD